MPEEVTDRQDLRDRIVAVLKIYPKLSPSMLQSGIGPHIKPVYWRPALESLIADGIVSQKNELMRHKKVCRTVAVLRLCIPSELSEDADSLTGTPNPNGVFTGTIDDFLRNRVLPEEDFSDDFEVNLTDDNLDTNSSRGNSNSNMNSNCARGLGESCPGWGTGCCGF